MKEIRLTPGFGTRNMINKLCQWTWQLRWNGQILLKITWQKAKVKIFE